MNVTDEARRNNRGEEAVGTWTAGDAVGEAGANHFAPDVAAAGGDRAGAAGPGVGIADPDGGGTGVGDLAGGTGIGTDDAGGDSGEAGAAGAGTSGAGGGSPACSRQVDMATIRASAVAMRRRLEGRPHGDSGEILAEERLR